MNDNQADILSWNAFKGGDREAFDNLFRRYYPVMIQYGSKFCPDRELLEDSIQELFIELWQSKSSADIQSVKAYLLKALKYKLFKHLKAGRAMQSTDQMTMEMNFELSHDHFIIDQEEKGQTTRTIVAAVNQLPNRQKEIVYLKIYQGLDYNEISEIMSINYQVARNLFSQSIKSLRQLLNHDDH